MIQIPAPLLVIGKLYNLTMSVSGAVWYLPPRVVCQVLKHYLVWGKLWVITLIVVKYCVKATPHEAQESGYSIWHFGDFSV